MPNAFNNGESVFRYYLESTWQTPKYTTICNPLVIAATPSLPTMQYASPQSFGMHFDQNTVDATSINLRNKFLAACVSSNRLCDG